jgi:hypothetical protein
MAGPIKDKPLFILPDKYLQVLTGLGNTTPAV